MKDDVELDYDYLTRNALRHVMRDVLSLVGDLGDAPGEHHFFIEFLTGAPGVTIPDYLKETYPERMTVVLQHQFENLVVTDNGFSVTLWFKGKEAHLKIPFAAVLSFADPSVEFGLRFGDGEDAVAIADTISSEAPSTDAETQTEPESGGDEEDAPAKSGDGADVVSLDAFRKK